MREFKPRIFSGAEGGNSAEVLTDNKGVAVSAIPYRCQQCGLEHASYGINGAWKCTRCHINSFQVKRK